MTFDVMVLDRAERTLHRTMADLVGDDAVHHEGDNLVLSIVDQSALVAILARLNDLGVNIEWVRRIPRHPSP